MMNITSSRVVLSVLMSACFFCGCVFDPSGVPSGEMPQDDGAVQNDVSVLIDGDHPDDGGVTDASLSDGQILDAISGDAEILDAEPDAEIVDAFVQEDAAPPDAGPVCEEADCPLGCTAPDGRCNRLNPLNFDVEDFYDDITGDLTIDPDKTVFVNTQGGSISAEGTDYRSGGNIGGVNQGIYFDRRTQSDGSTLAVFGVMNFTLPASSEIVVEGDAAVAFYVLEDALIEGIIDARAVAREPGPGGGGGGVTNGDAGGVCGDNSNGGGGGEHSTQPLESGGGGGANLGSGGRGGLVQYWLGGGWRTVAGGAGGAARTNTSLVPLVGGCGGGAGGGPDPGGGDGGFGGGGGGAVQVSCNGTLTIGSGGGVDVGGAGGQGGNYGAGGGAGGSGGSVLLEAAVVNNNGLIAANGGGGGAGGENTAHPVSEPGEDAHFSTDPALGGTGYYDSGNSCSGGFCYGGDGGSGGAGANNDGVRGEDNVPNSGGGGGGVGIIVLRYENTVNSGSCSPANIAQEQGLSLW